jgi:hypothetical protein
VNNRNAVAQAGVQCAARVYADLVKRYKGAEGGGLIPKKFVTDFLWQADPRDYAEQRLKGFLGEEAFDIWKEISKHMQAMTVWVKIDAFAKAIAPLLMSKPVPTAAAKEKLSAFLLACASDAARGGGGGGTAAAAAAAVGSVSLPSAPSLSISSPPGQRFIKVPGTITFDRTRPPPIHMKTRDTHRQVLLGLYFQRLSDPDWMNEVLAEYDLSDDKDDLISNGIKKGSDLGILMHEPSLLKDLSMTLIARAKLRILLKDLSEICNAHPEEDATMAATLDDVELR